LLFDEPLSSLDAKLRCSMRAEIRRVQPDDIYLRPASVFVADFVGRANFLEVLPPWVTAGRAGVHVFGREWDAACHELVRAGEPAYLVVRPETVTLTPTHENAEGVILSAVFHGPTAEYEVETSTGTLTVSAPRPEPGRMLSEGVSVTIELDEHRLYVLSKW
jgi:iron(III) transport system ATP-binding protein